MADRTLLDANLEAIVRGATDILRARQCPIDPLQMYDVWMLWEKPKARAAWLRRHPGAKPTSPQAKGAVFALLLVRDLRGALGHRQPDAVTIADKALHAGALAANLGIALVTSAKNRRAAQRPRRTSDHEDLLEAYRLERAKDPEAPRVAIAKRLAPRFVESWADPTDPVDAQTKIKGLSEKIRRLTKNPPQ